MKLIKKVYDFLNDDTLYYAASLSFFTIFSFLPILSLIIAFMSNSKYFAKHIDLLIMYVLDFINPTHSNTVSKTIENFLQNTDKLGSIGIIYLIFVFIMFAKDYDYIVSKIFNISRRNFIKTLFFYITVLVLLPVSIIFLTFIGTFFIHNYAQFFINLLLGIFLLSVIFIISINKKVSLSSIVLSSFLTLGILKSTQSLFAFYIIYNKTYATIYGTMSIIFFMFLWIYISWAIYLYGLKLIKVLND